MSAPARPQGRLEGKIGPRHRDRLAAVYVRQSTAQQVHDHTESTRLQYGLAERAAALGWAASRVRLQPAQPDCPFFTAMIRWQPAHSPAW